MDELKQQWAVTLEEKHEPITVIGGQRGAGKIFFLENMVKFLEEQLKQEKAEKERWKSAALYYADKLGSMQNLEVVRCKDCKHSRPTAWYSAKLRCAHPSCMSSQVPYEVPQDHFCGYGERRTDGSTDTRD